LPLDFVLPTGVGARGKLAIGTGALITPLFSNLGLNRLWVYFGQRSAYDGATETDAQGPAWRVDGRAYCASPTTVKPSLGHAAAYVKQISIARAFSANNSSPVKTVTATCPPGLSGTSIGGGGSLNAATNDIALDSLHQTAGRTAWTVKAHEVDATGAPWQLGAHAICANLTTEIKTANYVGPPTAADPDGIYGPDTIGPLVTGNTAKSTPCPPNTYIIGGGATILPATVGGKPPADVVLTSSRPAGNLAVANARYAEARDSDPPGQAYRLQVRAVCANFIGGPPS
jgi:hypothetical protein